VFNIRHALAPAIVLLAAWSPPVLAQDTRTREDLQLEIAERDALIVALRREVSELQARLGMVQPSVDSAPVATLERVPRPSEGGAMQLVVDELAAERALERTLVQSGALLLPRGGLELVPTLATAVSKIDFPVGVNVGSGIELGTNELDRTESVLGLTARFGLPRDSQIEIGFPYRAVTEEYLISVANAPPVELKQAARGRGDFTLGFAKTLLRESRGARPDIVGRLMWTSGEGTATDNGVFLGGGFESWTGSLSFVKRLDPLALFWSLGYTDTRSEGSIAPGEEVSVSFGTALAVTPHSSLFGSIVHRNISATKLDNTELAGSDVDVTTLSLGLSTTLRRGTLLTLYSEIGLSGDAPDYSLAFALPMRLR
jgi:hypothetical protein